MSERKSIRLYADERLMYWAEWSRRCADKGFGFKRRVNYFSLGDKTPFGAVPLLLATDDEALETEKVIHALPDQEQQVILTYYLRPGTRDQNARRCSCSVSTFYARLNSTLVMFFYQLQALKKSAQVCL